MPAKGTLSNPHSNPEIYPQFTDEAKAQRVKQLNPHGTAGQQVIRARATQVSSF